MYGANNIRRCNGLQVAELVKESRGSHTSSFPEVFCKTAKRAHLYLSPQFVKERPHALSQKRAPGTSVHIRTAAQREKVRGCGCDEPCACDSYHVSTNRYPVPTRGIRVGESQIGGACRNEFYHVIFLRADVHSAQHPVSTSVWNLTGLQRRHSSTHRNRNHECDSAPQSGILQ